MESRSPLECQVFGLVFRHQLSIPFGLVEEGNPLALFGLVEGGNPLASDIRQNWME